MIQTTSVVTEYPDVPNSWPFEYYLKLNEKLTGQDVNMHSVFNSKDNKPSLFIFLKNGKYSYKDFSAGLGGDAISLVQNMFQLERRWEAVHKIISDYNDYLLNNGKYPVAEFKKRAKFQIHKYKLRNWTEIDQKYWTRFKISSKILEFFNVSPLSEFTMKKEGTDKKITIRGARIYGYFKQNGELYKIYQPKSEDFKFFKVSNHIQGYEQLEYNKDYLVICSSLKDAMAFKKLGFINAEVVAPDSENSKLPNKVIEEFKSKYKGVCTLFDNDEAGLRAMLSYKELFDISGAHLKLEKDLAESVEQHGINNTRIAIYPVLTKALTGTIKHLP
tara:strand:- start:618 stop:1610 length:993 start_codon:yes stop_codon:yes gene_type:complete